MYRTAAPAFFPRLSIPVILNEVKDLEVKHLSGQAAERSFTSFRMTIGAVMGGQETRGRPHGAVPRLSIAVMLNEVKHLFGAGSRKILHFVQDDNWTVRGGQGTRGDRTGLSPACPSLSC